MAITEKCMKQIAFSSKLFQFNPRLIAKAGVPLTVTANGVRGKRIGVQSGSQFETYAQMNWQPAGVDVAAYQSQEGLFDDSMAGRLGGGLLTFSRSHCGSLNTPKGKGFAVVGDPLDMDGHGTGVGLRKGDSALKVKIDRAIASMEADGTYQTIAARYFNFDVHGN